MLWLANRRRLAVLEEESEKHTRDVRILRDAVEDLTARVQKLAFRVGKKLDAPSATEQPELNLTTGTQEEQSALRGRVDPISARLLARRARRTVAVNGLHTNEPEE